MELSEISNFSKKLVHEVEQSILDLHDYSVNLRGKVTENLGVPIQPLRDWTNQHAVITFKDILEDRFSNLIKNTLDKTEN